MRRTLRRFVLDDAGQDLIEYALLASLIAVSSIVGLGILGDNVRKWVADIVQAL